MFQSKGISNVSLMVNESENDQGCEYDICESGERNERWLAEHKLADGRHILD